MVLIALFAESGISQRQQKLCEEAKRYLDASTIPYEIVDGMEDEATRNKLFIAAGMSAFYPQFFERDEADRITHLGDLDALKRMHNSTGHSPQKSPTQKLRLNVDSPVTIATGHLPRVNAMTAAWPPQKGAGSDTDVAIEKVTADEAPLSRLLNSLRPSVLRGSSFHDDSSESSDDTPDFSSLRPSMMRGHSFDEAETKETNGNQSASLSLDFTHHTTIEGTRGRYESMLPTAQTDINSTGRSGLRPSIGRQGSFNKSPWASEEIGSLPGREKAFVDEKIHFKHSTSLNNQDSVDIVRHASAKIGLKIDVGKKSDGGTIVKPNALSAAEKSGAKLPSRGRVTNV